MNIMEYIPKGHENAACVSTLCARSGLSKRQLRHEIETARKESVVLNLQDGKGYFAPTEDEQKLVEVWVRQQMARAKSIRNGCKKAKLWLSRRSWNSSSDGGTE